MGIGTSLGAYFDDEFHYQSAQWDPKYDTNEYDTGEVQQKIETQPAKVTPVSDRIDVYQGDTPKSESPVSFLSAGKALNSAVDYTIGALSDPVKTVTDAATSLAESAKNAFTLPGDVLSGKVQPGSTQEIERAADLAGFMIGGPAPVASKLSEGTLGSFMGVGAKSFNPDRLQEAMALKGNGATVDEIWNKTGTFQGADTKWRQEIPDNKAKYDDLWNVYGSNPSTLGKVLDHPELYKAYPDLKDMKVNYNPRTPGAFYDTATDRIEIGSANSKETILHEVQHAIQEREGFAKGGTPAKNATLNYESDLNNLRKEFQSINAKYQSGKELSKEELDRIPYLDTVFKLQVLRQKAGYARSVENYQRLAGEVESRNVETRSGTPKNVLDKIPPIRTEDTPRFLQHVSEYPPWATPYGYGDPKVPPIP